MLCINSWTKNQKATVEFFPGLLLKILKHRKKILATNIMLTMTQTLCLNKPIKILKAKIISINNN